MLDSDKYPVNGAEAIADLETRRQAGATYVAFTKFTMHWLTDSLFKDLSTYLESRYHRVAETAEYTIFALRRAPD